MSDWTLERAARLRWEIERSNIPHSYELRGAALAGCRDLVADLCREYERLSLVAGAAEAQEKELSHAKAVADSLRHDLEMLEALYAKNLGELQGKLQARQGEGSAKSSIIDVLERKLSRAERKVESLERMRERSRGMAQRNGEKFWNLYREREQLRGAVEELRRAVNPRKFADGGDIRQVLELRDPVPFGAKHRGETVAYVVLTDPDYLLWMLREHSSHRPSVDAVRSAVDMIAGKRIREAKSEEPQRHLPHRLEALAAYARGDCQGEMAASSTLKPLEDGAAGRPREPREPRHFWLGGDLEDGSRQ